MGGGDGNVKPLPKNNISGFALDLTHFAISNISVDINLRIYVYCCPKQKLPTLIFPLKKKNVLVNECLLIS